MLANLSSVDGRALRDQPLDLRRREPSLAEHLDAVLAEPRRGALDRRARSAPPARDAGEPQAALGRVIDLLEETHRLEVRVVDEIVQLVEPHAGDVVRLEQVEP